MFCVFVSQKGRLPQKNKNILHNTKTIFKIIPQLYKTKTKTYLDTVKKIKHLHVSFLVGNFVPSWHQILIVLDGREAYFLLIISSFSSECYKNLKMNHNSMNTKAIFTFERKRSSQSNWRTRPVSLRSFELRYLEILHKFEAETSTLSDFMVESILFLLELIRKDARVTENSHRQRWRNHRLFPLVQKFLYLLELNEFDLETIKSEVEAVTTFRTSIPLYNLDEHKNRSINSLTDSDS